ncbi:E1 ubiquitin-activating protein uba2 [Sporothrix curviconia]|uniref:Ubiquitin-activating enzyme E1-like n=1 Tax=Sporothrix curviconia TaxID=1260050 RepID=A0ABP0B0B6_9PEZI
MAAAVDAPSAPVPQSRPTQVQMTPNAPRDAHNLSTLGPGLNALVKQSRVLLVGAGGIGCELLKTLVQSGFGEVHIVDLDTIDLSNLNRQFLFRHEHIKKSKALVARDAAQRFNPLVHLVAYHGDIKTFDVSFFAGFAIVFNALDNLDARRRVNRMCLAAGVPLIESGTAGFLGQVQVIKRGVTACYDCSPKEVPKSFPVCTIRSTPSQIIHCIVWGKSYLLNEMFGDSEDESAFDHSDDAQNATEIAELKKESQALKAIRQAIGSPDFAQKLFDKVFNDDLVRLRSMEDMWKTRAPPDPLTYADVMARETTAAAIAGKEQLLRDGQRVWTLEESVVVLNDSIDRLSQRVAAARASAKGHEGREAATIEFDKDDIDTLDFVVASANIRATLFGIERKSRFDVKQMAGNIIPAIATTNAIVAGLCVLQSFKVLRGQYDSVKEVFLAPNATEHMLASDRPRKPNPDCPVCSSFQVTLDVDFDRITLQDLVDNFAKEELRFDEDGEFVVSNEVGILYDIDETDNLGKKLSELSIGHGTFLTITDDSDEPFVNVVVNLQKAKGPLEGKPYAVVSFSDKNADGSAKIPKQPKKAPKPTPVANGVSSSTQPLTVEDDDDLIIPEIQPTTHKRVREDDAEEPAAKKAKTAEAPTNGVSSTADNNIVAVDGPANAAVVIDD